MANLGNDAYPFAYFWRNIVYVVRPREVTISQNTDVFHIMFLFKKSQYL